MAQPLQGKPHVLEADAVVIGAGLSGIAAAIHLARNGFRVLCIARLRETARRLGITTLKERVADFDVTRHSC
ncbi:MAG TPA: FAD-binding protein [Terracidiphilus sp.]|nr:FAD-binding protein [Terracidiphilus sp.]